MREKRERERERNKGREREKGGGKMDREIDEETRPRRARHL